MQVTIQTNYKGGITSAQMATLDVSLRAKISGLVSWGLQDVTGLLTLDLGPISESMFQSTVNSILQTISILLVGPTALTLSNVVSVTIVPVVA
jgi:hypothetical protein